MQKFINPRIDLCFKKIFGSIENKDILIDFINSVVSEADQVADITLLNPYNERSCATDKLSILDIKARDTQGKYFNIEIQISDQADYDRRALYYWAKLYADQVGKGDSYGVLRKTIGIHVLNFLSVPGKKNYHSVFTIRDLETNQQKFKDFELHTIELVKFDENTPDDIQSIVASIGHKLDLWVAFLTKYDVLSQAKLPAALESKAMHKALSVLSHLSLTKVEVERYEAAQKWILDEEAALRKAEEKGREQGRQESMQQVALHLIGLGQEVGFIAEATGLSIETVEALQ